MSKSKKGQPAAADSSKENLAYLIRKIFEERDDSEVDKKLKGFLEGMGELGSSLKIKDDQEGKLIELVISSNETLKNEEKLDLTGIHPPEGGIPWETVAHSAAQRGYLALLVVLDKCGADIDKRDQEYKRPIHRAIKYNHPDVFDYLLNHPDVQLDGVSGKFEDYAINVGLAPLVSVLGIPHVAFHSAVNAIGTTARFVASPLTGASLEEITEDSKSMHKETTEDLLRYSQRLTRSDVGLEYYAKKHNRLDFLEKIKEKKSQLNTGAAEDVHSTTQQPAKAIPISMEEVDKSNLVPAESRYATRRELVAAEDVKFLEPQNAIPITLEEGSNHDLVLAESRYTREHDPRAAEDVESSEQKKATPITSKKGSNHFPVRSESRYEIAERSAENAKSSMAEEESSTKIPVVAAPKTNDEANTEELVRALPAAPTHTIELLPAKASPNKAEEVQDHHIPKIGIPLAAAAPETATTFEEQFPEVPNHTPNLKSVVTKLGSSPTLNTRR